MEEQQNPLTYEIIKAAVAGEKLEEIPNFPMEVSLFYSIADKKQVLQRKRPDLLFVDRNMPDGNGDELCKRIRRLWGNQLTILYLTVRGETADIVQGFQDGADDYVVKPFELEVLYSRILALLRRSGQTKGNPAFLRSSFVGHR